jgi:SSS family solute:Na+ symporter
VLISSSAIAKDFYAGFINPGVSDKNLTTLMRWLSGFFILLSVVFAYFKPATIVAILGISWGAIGAVFLGPFIWGLFTRRANRYGAIVSAVIGLAACLILYFAYDVASPQSGTIGMIASLVLCPLVSLVTPGK